MGLTRFLVALHPKQWRQRYGEEYAALLDDTPLTASVVLDVVLHAARLRLPPRRVLVAWCFVVIAVQAGLSANVVWGRATPLRLLLLALFASPWAALAVHAGYRRHSRRAGQARERARQ
jgi:hypothetical protein